MQARRSLAILLGTRPEAIKLAPVVLALREARLPHVVIATGQHERLVDELLDELEIYPDVNLGLMREQQTLDYLLAASIERVGQELDRISPAAVVVQGDTTSVLGSALAAFHRHLPVAHVEAGLRSADLAFPFPEEMNRRAVSLIARWHFAPTPRAVENLTSERVGGEVHLVGNTVVDAVAHVLSNGESAVPPDLEAFLRDRPYVVATAHRRESWGEPIAGVARALREVLDAAPGHRLVFVVHPNPHAREPVVRALGDDERCTIVEALPYTVFLQILRGATLAVTDSGGVQEEGPTLGIPVLVTRHVTERPEGVDAGAVRIIGTNPATITETVLDLLRSTSTLDAMRRAGRGLYGDGRAAERIVRVLAEFEPS